MSIDSGDGAEEADLPVEDPREARQPNNPTELGRIDALPHAAVIFSEVSDVLEALYVADAVELRQALTLDLHRLLLNIITQCSAAGGFATALWLYNSSRETPLERYYECVGPIIGRVISIFEAPRLERRVDWVLTETSPISDVVLRFCMLCEYSWRIMHHAIALESPEEVDSLEHRQLLLPWLVNPVVASEKRKPSTFPKVLEFVARSVNQLGLKYRQHQPRENSAGKMESVMHFMRPVYDDGVFRYTYDAVVGVEEFLDALYQMHTSSWIGNYLLIHRKEIKDVFNGPYSSLPIVRQRKGLVGFEDGCLDLLHMRFYAWDTVDGLLLPGECTQIHYNIPFPIREALMEPADEGDAPEPDTDNEDYWPPHDGVPYLKFGIPRDTTNTYEWLATQLASVCPAVNQILVTQQFNDHERVDICGLLGRALLPNGLLDKFTVALVFIGRPRTGKTSIANLVQWWYPPQFTGKLMSTASAGFGSSELVSKHVVLMPEGSSKMRTSRTELNSMFAGEVFSFDQKFKDSVEGRTFRAPVVGASNSMLQSSTDPDPSLSLQRRIQYVEFVHSINEDGSGLDVTLADDLTERERAALSELRLCKTAAEWNAFVVRSGFGRHTIRSFENRTSGDIAYDLGVDVQHQAPWAMCICRLAYQAILDRMFRVRQASGRTISLDAAISGRLRTTRSNIVRKHYRPCTTIDQVFDTVAWPVFQGMSEDDKAQWTLSQKEFSDAIEEACSAEQARRVTDEEGFEVVLEYCELRRRAGQIFGVRQRPRPAGGVLGQF